jgi:hypothetical protein
MLQDSTPAAATPPINSATILEHAFTERKLNGLFAAASIVVDEEFQAASCWGLIPSMY